jgi:hypothetical protein
MKPLVSSWRNKWRCLGEEWRAQQHRSLGMTDTELEKTLSKTPITIQDAALGWKLVISALILSATIVGGIVHQVLAESSSENRISVLETQYKDLEQQVKLLDEQLSGDRLIIQQLIDTINNTPGQHRRIPSISLDKTPTNSSDAVMY